MAERGARTLTLEERNAIDNPIEKGRGGIWLELTEEQYGNVKMRWSLARLLNVP